MFSLSKFQNSNEVITQNIPSVKRFLRRQDCQSLEFKCGSLIDAQSIGRNLEFQAPVRRSVREHQP